MYTIPKNSIRYLETSRGVAFTARLLRDGDYVGEIENKGAGGMTTLWVNTPEVEAELEAVAKENNTRLEYLLEHLMDLAEGLEPDEDFKLPA